MSFINFNNKSELYEGKYSARVIAEALYSVETKNTKKIEATLSSVKEPVAISEALKFFSNKINALSALHVAKTNALPVNEGQFSWMTQDTGEQIGSEKENRITVYMYDNEGNQYKEDKYDGYGEFGGMDYYELLAKMNGYSEEDLEEVKGPFKEMRQLGIDLAFGKLKTKDKGRKVLFPALVEDPKFLWKRHNFTQEPESDPNQSWYVEPEYDAYESRVTEGAMSDIDILAQEAKDFKSFVKEFKKEYKNMDVGSAKELEAWLQSVYDSAKENMDEQFKVTEGREANRFGIESQHIGKLQDGKLSKYTEGNGMPFGLISRPETGLSDTDKNAVKDYVNADNIVLGFYPMEDSNNDTMYNAVKAGGIKVIQDLVSKEYGLKLIETIKGKRHCAGDTCSLMHYLVFSKTNEAIVTEAKYKPAGLTKEETLKVAETYAKAISKLEGVKCTVNMKTLEEDSFDLYLPGDEYAGGSYSIDSDGNVYNDGMGTGMKTPPIYGKSNDSVDTIVKTIKKLNKAKTNIIEFVEEGLSWDSLIEKINEEGLNERSINKIQKDWTKVTADMKDAVSAWKSAEGAEKEKMLAKLKELTAKKKGLEAELDDAVGLKDADAELVGESVDGYALNMLADGQLGMDPASEFLSKHNVDLNALKKAKIQKVISSYEIRDVVQGKARKSLEKEFFKNYVKEAVVTEADFGKPATVDHSDKMSYGQLENCIDNANMIRKRIEQGTSLDPWMHSQIAVAKNDLTSVFDALDGDDGVVEAESINEAKKLKRDDIIAWIENYIEVVRTSEEFDGAHGGIWVSGENGDLYKQMPIYDYYNEGSRNYSLGVLIAWEKELNKRGWYSEWYDAGTVMIWPN